MDQCKHCIACGNFHLCKKTPCSLRDSWGFYEAVVQAHMAGQVNSGWYKDPSFFEAHRYFINIYEKENEK